MRVKFWGTRGSIPTPVTAEDCRIKIKHLLMNAKNVDLSDESAVEAYLAGRPIPEAMTFGGNTPCLEVTEGSSQLILDCGSGMQPLGRAMMHDIAPSRCINILQTHTHWDHIMGFPFFAPAYAATEIHIYGVHPNMRERFEQQMDRIHFPITMDEMRASITFHQLGAGEQLVLDPFTITNMGLHHPGGSYSYRIASGNRTFVYATDGEYKDPTAANLKPYAAFFKNADVLVFDTMYSTIEKVIEKENYGHSTPLIGMSMALSAGVKKLVFFHHDPESNDIQIAESYFDAKRYLAKRTADAENPLEIVLSYDGLEMDV